jgi:hypothetical protein
MWMTIGERRFAITLADNAAARAFEAQLPLTLDMSELNARPEEAPGRGAPSRRWPVVPNDHIPSDKEGGDDRRPLRQFRDGRERSGPLSLGQVSPAVSSVVGEPP